MNAPPRAARLAAPAAVVAVLLLFFAPALVGPGQFLYRDSGRHYHPMKQWLAAEWRTGHYPEWNPNAGLGLPVVAGGIDAPQHPLNALFLLLPFEPAFTLWVVACYLAAGLGTMAWLRALGTGRGAAALGALAFALSGFLVSSSDNLIHLASMAAAPWLLAAARRHAAQGGPGTLAAVGAASFLVAAGGEVLDWAVALPLAALLGAAPGLSATAAPPGPLPRVRRGAGTLLAGLLGAAPVVLPFFAALPASSRGSPLDLAETARWNLHPIRLAELVLPHLVRGPFGSIRNELYQRLTGDPMPTPWTLSLYLGAPVVALALLAAVRSAAGRWLFVLAAAGLWTAMGAHAGFGALAARLPALSGVRYFERLAGWPSLALAAGAALGAAGLLADPPSARRPAIAWGASGVLLATAGLLAGASGRLGDALAPALGGEALAAPLAENLAEGARHAGLSLALLGVASWLLARGRLGRAAPVLLAAVVTLDLAGANARAYLLAPPALVDSSAAPIPAWLAAQPERTRVTTPFALDRERWPELLPFESSFRWGARTAASSFHAATGIRSLDSYAGVVPGRLHRFQRRVPVAARARVAGLVGLAAVVVPHRLERAAEAGLAPPWRVLAADPELPAWLVEVPHRPRAYLAGEILSVDEAGALEFLAHADPVLEARTALEGAAPPGYRSPRGTAEVVRDDPDRVDVAVEAGGPALVVLGDQVEAGWSADVDGAAAPILAANALARAVWVPPGRHTVAFRYHTPGWRAGWALLGLGLAALAAAAWWRHRPAPG